MQRDLANEQFTINSQSQRLLGARTEEEKKYYQSTIDNSQAAADALQGDLNILNSARGKALTDANKDERDAVKAAADARNKI